jgi:chemotaxis protein methyltransferase WspC
VTITEVENLIVTRLGFDIHSVGPQAIESVVRQTMEEADCSDPAAYARKLAANQNAWDYLVERLVIPETWFFRDIAPFELAADLARARMGCASNDVLRILSCPCSTGEEPYSLAMAMLNRGAPAESFIVDAVDVSQRALESAQAAVFRTRSFREENPWYRVPYFDRAEDDGFWRLKDSVTSLVRFRRGNLIAPDFLEDEKPYDVVFCRNLLIYLHSDAKPLALKALRRLTAQDGVLVLGHAEAAFAREYGFTPKGPAAAFAFVKPSDRVVPKAQSKNRRKAPASVAPRPPSVATDAPFAPAIDAAPSRRESELSQLVLARQLGDAGRLPDALRECGEYLKRVPDSAEGHFLLGVLHDALGRSELAMDSFRKALYLDPAHREALLHLALKREALGDGSGAALLRARAARNQDIGTTG